MTNQKVKGIQASGLWRLSNHSPLIPSLPISHTFSFCVSFLIFFPLCPPPWPPSPLPPSAFPHFCLSSCPLSSARLPASFSPPHPQSVLLQSPLLLSFTPALYGVNICSCMGSPHVLVSSPPQALSPYFLLPQPAPVPSHISSPEGNPQKPSWPPPSSTLWLQGLRDQSASPCTQRDKRPR